jgi:hypothetical protein
MLLAKIVRLVDILYARGKEVSIHWISAYIRVQGNKNANLLAKMATGWQLARKAD